MILTCVVTYNRLAYTKRCIESLLDTGGHAEHMVIVDNGSTDGTREWLARLPNVILADSNLYPGAACNRGWDYGLRRFNADLLHRSDNDIEYLPGWRDEVEMIMDRWPEAALLGILNLHEDRHIDGRDDDGVDAADRVGGNVVLRRRHFGAGLRWHEGPWRVNSDEDGPMSWEAKAHGMVIRLRKTVANNMAFGRFADYPDYYRATAKARGIADAEHSV